MKIKESKNQNSKNQKIKLKEAKTFVSEASKPPAGARISRARRARNSSIVKTPTTTSIQLITTTIDVGFDTIMTVHTTTNFTTRNSSPALERLQGRVNQRNLRQSY